MFVGCPLGPILANIFMGYIELKVVLAFKNKLLYLRYVDISSEARKLLMNFSIFWIMLVTLLVSFLNLLK